MCVKISSIVEVKRNENILLVDLVIPEQIKQQKNNTSQLKGGTPSTIPSFFVSL